ncbi:mechanosensitive ion channel family protein [Halieaceae bacterium]|nr:mechanosensitive ion channel family protein [Halieaceae bacterium]
MKPNSVKLIKLHGLLTVLLLALLTAPAGAQEESSPDASMREILEQDQQAEKLVKEKTRSSPAGELSGQTPLEALLALRKDMREKRHDRAEHYLDLRYLPEGMEAYSAEQLLEALAYVFGQQNIIDINQLSDSPQGNLDDGLPSYRDQIGTVTISSGDVPIYLQRVPDGKGGHVWKISNATVARIPEMWEELGYSPVAIFISKLLPETTFMGMDNWQLAATIFFFIIAWPLAALGSYILMRIALLIPNGFPLGIKRFFRISVRFFLFIAIARILINQLGLSLTARVYLESSGVDYIAYTVLVLGLVSLLRDYQIRKMERAGKAHYAALLRPFTTIFKILLITGIALFWADQAGYNMSTILAGLGVGSLAVALAAQKTLENVIGAITLYTARPVKPGDFCRFGTVKGTVEEIGLRSTVIRTMNRTLLVIPNSIFSSVEVENYTSRDRIRFYRELQLQMTTADQLRVILGHLRELFYSHPMVQQETASVRFERIDAATAVIRIDAGIPTRDFLEYLAVSEDLNLRMVELIHACGAVFSGPGQVLQLREFYQASDAKMAEITSTLSQWREQDRLPFPDYSEDAKAAMVDSLDYPPKNRPT